MKKFGLDFEFEPQLNGLYSVEVADIAIKTNSRGKYLDIEVKVEGFDKNQHIFNNINEDTRNYVVAQLCNAGNQLKLPKMNSSELIKNIVGKKLEITVSNNGFSIAPYTQLSKEEPEEI